MSREYRQFCGLSHALDLIGGRWTLLIVRDLLTGPLRFTDLERGLPGIPTNILSTRLRELEEAGLVERQLLPRPASGFVYSLTEYGRELEDPLMRLGLWGAKSLTAPGPDDYVAGPSLVLGLRAMFHADAAREVTLTFDIQAGEDITRGSIRNGELSVPDHTDGPPDLLITADPAAVVSIFKGARTVDEAIARGDLPFEGAEADLRMFFEVFHMRDEAELLSPA